MYPLIFGFIDSYVLMILVGIIACFILLVSYLKKNKVSKIEIIDVLLMAIGAIIAGIIFANLFENLYEFIDSPSTYKWTWGLTFYGGLFGGVLTFLLLYLFWYKKHHQGIVKNILVIAPGCITLAHFFGRIGCFLDGCCYGKDTSEWYGLYFPTLGRSVIPTQLIEAFGLLILTVILVLLAFKKNYKYNFVIYMASYGILRFLIEFLRGDNRGAFLGVFSPSQVWCFGLIIGAVIYSILVSKLLYKYEK